MCYENKQFAVRLSGKLNKNLIYRRRWRVGGSDQGCTIIRKLHFRRPVNIGDHHQASTGLDAKIFGLGLDHLALLASLVISEKNSAR